MASNWNVGDRIQGRWEVLRIIPGGMGIVYVVYDPEFREIFAAKTFKNEILGISPTVAARFQQEALAWVNLDVHPNITQARMVRIVEGKPLLFLEYVSGGDLSRWIGSPRLTGNLMTILNFGIQFCDGLDYARSKGVEVHRDIKPENCLITENDSLKVTDFGLAKLFDDSDIQKNVKASMSDRGIFGRLLGGGHVGRIHREVGNMSFEASSTGIVVGTCTHMAPEQFDDSKNVDARADVYSFGVMLFQMVAGGLPFSASTWKDFETMHKTRLPPQLHPSNHPLQAVIQKCLAKDRSKRYDNFRELRERLAQIYQTVCGQRAPEPVKGVQLNALHLAN